MCIYNFHITLCTQMTIISFFVTSPTLSHSLSFHFDEILSLVIMGIMDINPDPGCCRTIDTDMVPGSRWGLDNTMVLVDSTEQSDQHGPGGTCVATGCGLDLNHLWWQHELQISIYISAVVGSWTLTWSLEAS